MKQMQNMNNRAMHTKQQTFETLHNLILMNYMILNKLFQVLLQIVISVTKGMKNDILLFQKYKLDLVLLHKLKLKLILSFFLFAGNLVLKISQY